MQRGSLSPDYEGCIFVFNILCELLEFEEDIFIKSFHRSNEEMNQEHLETCEGTGYERRGLDMSSWRGILDFWRRMTSRLQDFKKPKPKLAAATDEVRQQRTLHDT